MLRTVLITTAMGLLLAACGPGTETEKPAEPEASAPPAEPTSTSPPLPESYGLIKPENVVTGQIWFRPEGGWTSEELTEITLPGLPESGTLEITYSPWFPADGSVEERTFEFRLDGEVIAVEVVRDEERPENNELTANAPFTALSADPVLGIMSTPVGSPSDFGESSDARNLGVFLHSVTLGE